MKSLDKKWKELLFAFSGFGPNFLMVLMSSYFSDAINPSALEAGEQYQAILPGVCFILPAIFPIFFMLGKVFDGIIDIPFAHITDSLSTRWGKRRPTIALSFIPMVVSFALCWIPIGGEDGKLLNTIWITVFSILFFASYTMSMISFYGAFSSVCETETQRMRISSYKSFFDTLTYCFVYALVPVVLSATHLHIDTLVFLSIPLMLTMLIPLFMIKEGEKYGYPERTEEKTQKHSLFNSLRTTFQNTLFRRWLVVCSFTFFGLQMFLAAMNGLIIGGMGLSGLHMTLFNTCAFAPVPIMLYLFKKVKVRFGVRTAYKSCLALFAVAIMNFFLGSRYLLGEGVTTPKLVFGIVGGLMASWSIGVFFMMPYLIPSQISSVEARLTGKNHSAMYFAGNAVIVSIVGAISGSLIYEYIKNLFISKDLSGIVWATSSSEAYGKFIGTTDPGFVATAEQAASVYNLGNLLVPFVVAISCIAGLIVARRLPRDYSDAIIAEEMKKQDPSLDISSIQASPADHEKGEITFVQIGLWVLSGSLFGFIWSAFLLKSTKAFKGILAVLAYLACVMIPFAQIPVILAMRRKMLAQAKEQGIDLKINPVTPVALSILFPILPVNMITLAILQSKMNKLVGAN